MGRTSMDTGKTKNGHSVLLRLEYRDLSVLFGGDLNTPAGGHRAVIAFRREKSSQTKRWFYYEPEKDSDGVFQVKATNSH